MRTLIFRFHFLRIMLKIKYTKYMYTSFSCVITKIKFHIMFKKVLANFTDQTDLF